MIAIKLISQIKVLQENFCNCYSEMCTKNLVSLMAKYSQATDPTITFL